MYGWHSNMGDICTLLAMGKVTLETHGNCREPSGFLRIVSVCSTRSACLYKKTKLFLEKSLAKADIRVNRAPG